MQKLYAVLLGGRAQGCNVELHDVVFVVGNSLEETYPALINKWFGAPMIPHIDASVELKYIDGYEVVISNMQSPESDQHKLFFVNYGGYQEGVFSEVHEANFYVATSDATAKDRAKIELCVGALEQHCDDKVAIADDIIAIDRVDQYFIQLRPTECAAELDIKAKYVGLKNFPDVLAEAARLRG